MLELTEEVICRCAAAVSPSKQLEPIQYGDETIDLTKRPWRRASMNDLVIEACNVDVLNGFDGDLEKAKAACEPALKAHFETSRRFHTSRERFAKPRDFVERNVRSDRRGYFTPTNVRSRSSD